LLLDVIGIRFYGWEQSACFGELALPGRPRWRDWHCDGECERHRRVARQGVTHRLHGEKANHALVGFGFFWRVVANATAAHGERSRTALALWCSGYVEFYHWAAPAFATGGNTRR